MGIPRVSLLAASAFLLAAPLLGAQDLSRYRDAELGTSLQTVAAAVGIDQKAATIEHQRPILMRDLEWRPRPLGGSISTADPVRRVLFSFYDDQLFRVAVSYGRSQIEGLTDSDLVDAISERYGASTPSPARPLQPSESPDRSENHTVVARWENAEISIVLLRGTYLSPVSLVMLHKRLAGAARTAAAEAERLDVLEAPQRAADERQEAEDAGRIAQEKARPGNKAAFKP
jgi:hypothetical protein